VRTSTQTIDLSLAGFVMELSGFCQFFETPEERMGWTLKGNPACSKKNEDFISWGPLGGDLKFRLRFQRLQMQDGGKPVAGVAGWVGGDLFGGAGGDDLTAAAAAFGAHVDDPVGRFDDVEIVLDDEEGAAAFDELAEGGEEFGDVVEVEAGGGLVEDVQGAAASLGGSFVCRAAVGDAARGRQV
jgi:hypothetical protein